jgi:hypothetical protein
MNDQDVKPADTSSVSVSDVQTDSSTVTPVSETTPASTDVPAPSPESAKPEEGKTPLDVVRSVLKANLPAKPDAQAKTPDPAASTDTTKPDATAEAKLTELTPEEEAKLPFHKHPRWKQLISEKNELRERATALEEPARQFGLVQEFMAKNSLTSSGMADLFTVAALMQNDPAQAIPVVQNYLEQLQLITGQKLPPDLASQVDDGAITEAAAKELHMARLNVSRSQTAAQEAAIQAQDNARRVRETENVAAVNAWEQTAKAADPDFDRKKPFVIDAIKVRIAAEPNVTQARAVQIAREAYASVNERFKGLTPQQRPLTPTTPRGGDTVASSTGQHTSAPKSALEAVKRGLAQG